MAIKHVEAVASVFALSVMCLCADAMSDARIDSDRVVVGSMFAPFCRTEAADSSEWAADVAKMRELGYNCLHGFCEWSRIEKAKGEYDFSEIDKLLDICESNGVHAILNVATQNTVGYHMPAWMENEYRGRGLVDSDGCGIPFHGVHNVPCLDDPWYRERAERYLKAVAARYAGDRRVAGWVVWGEPVLSSPRGQPICFCEHTVSRFRDWLKGRYGTIGALNKAWSTEGPVDFGDFGSVRPPRGALGHLGGYAAWSDWGNFMSVNFARNVKWADALLKGGGATQPTIVEMFCRLTTGGVVNDVWTLGGTADIVGASCFVRPGVGVELAMTVAASVAAREGKSVFVVEQTGGSRGYSYNRCTPGIEEMLSEVTQCAGLGAKGAMYWCWRPRLTDFEAGNFGLCRADGKPLPRAVAGGRHAASVSALGRRLADAERRPQVAVLHSTAVFSDTDHVAKDMLDAETGALRLFLDAHVTPQIVSADMVRDGLDPALRALVLPFAYALDEDTCTGIRRFVERGGCVIADHNLAFKATDGRAWRRLPGGGLDEVFGLEKEETRYLEHDSQLPPGNVYGIPLQTFMDVVTPTAAETLERDGECPLVLRHRFGRGDAYYFAFSAFPAYARSGGNRELRRRVMRMLEPCGVKPFVDLGGLDEEKSPHVRVAELVRADGAKILTFTNPGWETNSVEATVADAASVSKFLCGDVDVKTDGGKASFTLGPWQSIMLEARCHVEREIAGARPVPFLGACRARYERELVDGIIPFWERHSIDRECGGFFSCLERDGKVYDTSKQMWMQAREVYMFAALYNSEFRQERWLEIAKSGWDWIAAHGRKSAGDYHLMTDRRGAAVEDAPSGSADFTACFVAMAAAELYKATGRAEYRDEARACLDFYRKSCVRAESPSATFPGRVAYRQLAHPMFRLNVMLVLHDCGVGDYGAEMDSAIDEMRLFTDPSTGLVYERRLPNGALDADSQDGRFVNPGHSLEGLSFALHRIRRSGREDHREWALRSVRALGEFAIDPKDGGLTYYRDGKGKPVAKFEAPLKVWWGNCEAASAFLQAYELSGDKWFLDAFMSIDRFNFRHLKDPLYPEWYAYAAVEGRQFHSYKGSKWKTFFHLPRHLLTCIEAMKRIEGRDAK